MQFWQSCLKSFTRSLKKICEITFFSIKSFFPKMILWKFRFRFWQPWRKNFTRTPQEFMTLWFFSKWKFRPKVFIWEKRTQFSQTCWIFFSRSPEKINEPVVFSNESVLHKCSFENIECKFDNPAKNIWTKDRKKIWT